MKSHQFTGLAGAIFVSVLSVMPAHAQNATSWVASTGNDGAACTRTAPCATFNRAVTQTVPGGAVTCLDSGSFLAPGGLVITQAVGINCGSVEAYAEPGAGTSPAFTINLPANPPATANGVTIRGVRISGRVDETVRTNAPGINILSSGPVVIGDVAISNFQQAGIRDSRSLTRGAFLKIKNTTIRYNNGPGILLAVTTNNFPYGASIDHVESSQNGYGIATAANNRATISDSIFVSNGNANIEADGNASLFVSRSVSSNSTLGIQAYGQIRISDSDIVENATGLFGNVQSFGNNRIQNAAGNTPSSPAGQQ